MSALNREKTLSSPLPPGALQFMVCSFFHTGNKEMLSDTGVGAAPGPRRVKKTRGKSELSNSEGHTEGDFQM